MTGYATRDTKRVGVIGLGNMGLPMAAVLAKAGFEVFGFDPSPARPALASQSGIAVPPDLATMLRDVDAVVSSLPCARDVEAVLTTPDRATFPDAQDFTRMAGYQPKASP